VDNLLQGKTNPYLATRGIANRLARDLNRLQGDDKKPES